MQLHCVGNFLTWPAGLQLAYGAMVGVSVGHAAGCRCGAGDKYDAQRSFLQTWKISVQHFKKMEEYLRVSWHVVVKLLV